MAGDVLGNFSSDDLQDILEMDPELKAFAQSLRGLPEDERDRRINEYFDIRYPEDTPPEDT